MNNEIENPYEFLGISEDIKLDELKKLTNPLLKSLHPDRGGNIENFEKTKNAIKIIIDNIKTNKKNGIVPKTHLDMKKDIEKQLNVPTDVTIDVTKKYDNEEWNSLWNKRFNINTDVKIKTKDEILNERKKIDDELKNQVDLFSGKTFDSNIFNNIFVHTNPNELSTGVNTYVEPKEFNKNFSSLNYVPIGKTDADFSTSSFSLTNDKNEYDNFFKNKNVSTKLDNSLINSFKNKDITNVVLTQEDKDNMKKKMSEYNKFNYVIPQVNNSDMLKQEVIQKTSENIDFNRYVSERNSLK